MCRHRQQSWGIWEEVSPCCAAGNYCDCHLQVRCWSGPRSSQLGEASYEYRQVAAGQTAGETGQELSAAFCFCYYFFVDDEAGPGLYFVSLARRHEQLS